MLEKGTVAFLKGGIGVGNRTDRFKGKATTEWGEPKRPSRKKRAFSGDILVANT